jgi:YD repeat-containing protein
MGAGGRFVNSHWKCAEVSDLVFTYTQSVKRQTMCDAGGTTTYNYDDRDHLQSKQTPFGKPTYTYDNAGNLLSIASSNLNGASVSYKSDQLNRLSTVTDNAAQLAGAANVLATYGYDPAGNLKSVAYPNNVTTSYSYDLHSPLDMKQRVVEMRKRLPD